MAKEFNDESVSEREAIGYRLMQVRSALNCTSAMFSVIDDDEDTLADMNVWLSDLERDVDFLLNVVRKRYEEMPKEDE